MAAFIIGDALGLDPQLSVTTTLFLPFSVNHSIRIAHDYMAKWELVWPKLPETSNGKSFTNG
jgi:hypothetical protein